MSNKIIVGSFNYLVVSLAIKYVENDLEMLGIAKDSLDFKAKILKFNQNNDFSISKISLFPFLLTIANGKKPILLTHFTKDNFYFSPNENGIINVELNNLVEAKSDQLFFISNSISSTLKVEQLDFLVFDDFKQHLLKNFFDNDDKNILETINYSINFLHTNRISFFANRSFAQLSYWCKNNFAYRVYSPTIIGNESTTFLPFKDSFRKTIETENYSLSETVIQ
jgi:hypothetical protein